MSDLASYTADHARAARTRPRLRCMVVPTCHFHCCAHLRLPLCRKDTRVFMLCSVTPDGSFLFTHERDVRAG